MLRFAERKVFAKLLGGAGLIWVEVWPDGTTHLMLDVDTMGGPRRRSRRRMLPPRLGHARCSHGCRGHRGSRGLEIQIAYFIGAEKRPVPEN
jgi:hypothetical protein